MCPPTDCCCCKLHPGVKAWTIVFIVLQSIGVAWVFIASSILQAIHTTWCDGDSISPEHKDACDNFQTVIMLLWISLALLVMELITCSWGCCQINNFNAGGIATFWKIEAVLLVLNVLLGIITATMNKMSPDWASPIATAILGGWYVWAVKVLAERVAKGEISQQNPDGIVGGAPAVVQGQATQGIPVQAVPVQAVAQVQMTNTVQK